jgi:hypothetical protein
MSTSKVIQFTAALERECKSRKLRVGLWHGGSKNTSNLVQIEGAAVRRLLYVKDRSEDPGFWGLNENQLSKLRSSGLEWFVILLVGPSESGYLLTTAEVEKGASSWSQSGSDFKVHEGHEVSGGFQFRSFSDVFPRLTDGLS